MGENFHQPPYAEIQPSRKPYLPSHVEEDTTHDAAITNGEEEPYTIKCICGFDDDAFDGATVFCEQCNTWQHIACYYSPNITLSPDAEHICVDCNPNQHVDATAAAHHQRLLRQPQATGDDRKSKKAGQKNHKKNKTRDLNNNAVHVNGWNSQDNYFASPSNGSPRDSQPPAKRPKTTHRPSGSVSNGHGRQPNGRHRSVSRLQALANPPKLPLDQCPPDYLSPDFIRVHQENNDFNPVSANMHLNINVTNLLSTWLDDQDAFADATNGKTHSEVFQHFPQPIEELETPIQKHTHQEPTVRFHGATPQWPYLSVNQDLIAEQFVGELRGCIGRREDYQNDLANQWDKLRHPDHFVFFHPTLPIYIDSRQEGTVLRYVRRSCRPNLKMATIITGAREYRFCFTALVDIPRGTEITIPWDTKHDTHFQNALSKGVANMSIDDFLYVSEWAGNNLAHFGGCACEHQPTDEPCLLARFDRRAAKDLPDALLADSKPRKKRVGKKMQAVNASQGTNSRESSAEALHANHDEDVDMNDDHSTSLSSKSSRDTTPSNKANHGNNDVSVREQRKLSQLQRLIDQVDSNKVVPPNKRKKRGSGSNTQTPSINSQRQSIRPELSASNPPTPASNSRLPFAPPRKSPGAHSPPTMNVGRTTHPRAVPHQPKPIYADASTQTDPEKPPPNVAHIEKMKRDYLPRSKQLLRRSLLQSHLRTRSSLSLSSDVPKVSPSQSPETSQTMDTASSGSSTPAIAPQDPLSKNEEVKDVEMVDSEPTTAPMPEAAAPPRPLEDSLTLIDPTQAPLLAAHPPIKPPPPPWTASSPVKDIDTQQSPTNAPVASMHIDLPPNDFAKPALPALSPSQNADSTPGLPVQSPSVAVFSPSLPTTAVTTQVNADTNSITRPSPVKKKMSLSDYMNKNKQRKLETPGSDKAPPGGIQKSPPGSAGGDSSIKTTENPPEGGDNKG